jgi:hypothetical protein
VELACIIAHFEAKHSSDYAYANRSGLSSEKILNRLLVDDVIEYGRKTHGEWEDPRNKGWRLYFIVNQAAGFSPG